MAGRIARIQNGTPSVSIGVKIALDGKQRTTWAIADEFVEVKAVFYTGPQEETGVPGIKVDDSFNYSVNSKNENQLGSKTIKQEPLQVVFCFRYGTGFLSGMESIRGLPRGHWITMNHPAILFLQKPVREPAHLGLNWQTTYNGTLNLLKHISWATELRLSPWYPYRLVDRSLECDPHKWPKIKDFWGGMWANYKPKQQLGDHPPSWITGADVANYYKSPHVDSFHSATHYWVKGAVYAIREHQHQLKTVDEKTFTGETPTGLSITPSSERKYFYFYIKLRHYGDRSGREYIPSTGTKYRIHFLSEPSSDSKKGNTKDTPWNGLVVDPIAMNTQLKDFILFARKPFDGRVISVGGKPTKEHRYKVKLVAEINSVSMKRQLEAVNTIRTAAPLRSDLLDFQHIVLGNNWQYSGSPWREFSMLDLKDGPLVEWSDSRRLQIQKLEAQHRSRLNEAQWSAYKTQWLSLIVGPPATGKTTTLAAIAIMLACRGHKLLITAASNWACNRITTDIVTAIAQSADLIQDLADIGKLRIVRFHRPSAEFDYSTTAQTWDPTKSNADLETVLTPEMDHYLESVSKHRSLQQRRHIKDFNPYFLHERYSLGEAIHMEVEADRTIFGDGPHRTDEMEDDTTDMDHTRRFRELADAYANPTIELSGDDKKALFVEWKKVAQVVIAGLHMGITTNNNAGSKILAEMNPTFIIADEGAQSTELDTDIPLVRWSTVRGRIIAGDEKQLQPTITST
ncbi:MAG: Tripartite DNA replication factor [Candelina submexicana]|nr:MAG: Tripartite DNA replication factor [Candelina submexicana]